MDTVEIFEKEEEMPEAINLAEEFESGLEEGENADE